MKVYQLAENIRKDVESVFAILAGHNLKTSDPFAEVPDELAVAVLEAHPFNSKPESVTLNNFKAFGHDEQRIPLKPLTLIFGPNSAGKSSFLHSQLWLHHAFTEGELDVHRPKLAGDLVDLGGLRNVIYKKGTDGKSFTVSYSFNVDTINQALKDLMGEALDTLHYEFTITDHNAMVETPAAERPMVMGGSIDNIRILVGTKRWELLRASRRRSGHFSIDNFSLREHPFESIWKILQSGLSLKSGFTNFEEQVLDLLFDWCVAEIVLGPTHFTQLPDKANFIGKPLKFYDAIADLRRNDENQNSGAPDELEHGDIAETHAYYHEEDEYFPEQEDREYDPSPASDLDDYVDTPTQEELHAYDDQKLKEAAENLVGIVETTLTTLLKESKAMLETHLESLHYLGSQRAYPERGFTFNTKRDINWKANGGEAWDRLAKEKPLRDKVNAWLQDPEHLKTPYKLAMRKFVDLENTERIIEEEMDDAYNDATSGEVDLSAYDVNDPSSEGSRVDLMEWDSAKAAAQIKTRAAVSGEVESYSDLYLVDSNSNTIVSHRDVGVGITQLIPILATAMSLEGKTVLIEEPESHLHPKAQTELADVFIDSALKTGATNSFVIETHSEHFILRMLRRIRECSESPEDYPEHLPKITPEDVSVIYMDPSKEGAKAHPLRISEDGDFLDKWPNGFFAERREELF